MNHYHVDVATSQRVYCTSVQRTAASASVRIHVQHTAASSHHKYTSQHTLQLIIAHTASHPSTNMGYRVRLLQQGSRVVKWQVCRYVGACWQVCMWDYATLCNILQQLCNILQQQDRSKSSLTCIDSIWVMTRLELTVPHCNTLQLQYTATHCNTLQLQYTATHCYKSSLTCINCISVMTHYNAPHHTAIHYNCNTLQLQYTTTAIHCNTLQQVFTYEHLMYVSHCNLQPTAPH